MRKGTFIFCLVLLFSCGEKKTDLTGNTPLKINDFNKAFKLATLPVTITDTNLTKFTDTVQIGHKALVQFIPDSIVEQIIADKDKKAVLHPILKIEKEEEYYLLLNVQHPTQQDIAGKIIEYIERGLDYCMKMQFTNPADPNLKGAILEKILPPDGTDRSPYYIRDLGTIFFIQAASLYLHMHYIKKLQIVSFL